MFIRLFIKTNAQDKATETVKNVVSNIPESYVRNISVNIEPFWKFDNISIAEIKLELLKELDDEVKSNFLYCISDNWEFFNPDKSAALSSETMKGGSTLKYDLEMIDVYFRV